MKKRLVSMILCLLLALLSLFRVYAEKEESSHNIFPATVADFDVPCTAALLIDEDSGTVLYEKNADERRPIASITKVMTLLLTFEALEAGKITANDPVPVSEHAYHMGGSQIWLEPGEKMSLDDMLKAICISSANDAAVAVAEYVAGSEDAFVKDMNARAATLGMSSTTFRNACGLDEEGHLSTARDVARMCREILLHHSEVRKYCTVWTDTLRGGKTQLVNTNKLLKNYPGITGLKTGTTGKAGVCISASAERNGLRLIAVVLGSASGKERFQAARALLDYGFANYESISLALPANVPEALTVSRGTADSVPLCYNVPQSLLMQKGADGNLHTVIDLPDKIAAPITEGSCLGTVRILQNGQEIADYSITAKCDIDAISFGYCFRRLFDSLLLST